MKVMVLTTSSRPFSTRVDSVGAILKQAVTRAGFDPAPFAGHTLRASFATQAARNGVTAFDIMRVTPATA